MDRPARSLSADGFHAGHFDDAVAEAWVKASGFSV